MKLFVNTTSMCPSTGDFCPHSGPDEPPDHRVHDRQRCRANALKATWAPSSDSLVPSGVNNHQQSLAGGGNR